MVRREGQSGGSYLARIQGSIPERADFSELAV